MPNKLFCIYLFLIFHPIRFSKMLRHCQTMNHYYNMNVVNFNFDVWCDNCGEIFSDEVK